MSGRRAACLPSELSAMVLDRLSSRLTMAAVAALLVSGLAACAADDENDGPARSPVDSAGVATVAQDSARADSSAPDGSAPDSSAPDSSAPDSSAPDDSAPADEREAAPDAVMGAEWTAGDTERERPVTGASLLGAMRTARHDGFDRIVLDFGQDDVPGYRISYIDRPVRQCGSGDEVPMAGDGWLSITVEPANAHTEQGEPTIRERERAPGLPVLLELKMICDFEAQVEVVAGVASPERYRSFVLASPNRLVVDIMHPD